ncbi:hypothetical protein ABKN59_000385 [Abortiporus biennis]
MSLPSHPSYRTLRQLLQLSAFEQSFSRSRRSTGKLDSTQSVPDSPLYDVWLKSRFVRGEFLCPGAQREMSTENAKVALRITRECAPAFFKLLWSMHPIRIIAMLSLEIIRGIFPAFRGYSQALVVDEIQSLVVSNSFAWSRLARLIATELARMVLEGIVDSFSTSNETVVQNSAKYILEYKQMEQRIQMDVPTLCDPVVRDLFRESDLFVQSFSGTSSFGLFCPFEFVRILTLVSEIASHTVVVCALFLNGPYRWLLVLSIVTTLLPFILPFAGGSRLYYHDDSHNSAEARILAKQEKMNALSLSRANRPEVILFGLGPWILKSWATARRKVLGLDSSQKLTFTTENDLLSYVNVTGIFSAVKNIPLLIILHSSSASLGALTLCSITVQSLVFSFRHLLNMLRMAFQGTFLLGAFTAAMEVKPKLRPTEETAIRYSSTSNGMRIEARNISYNYPGCKEPALRNVSFTLQAGETLAIVGFNGSGKSTLANILLRISDFTSGDLLVNGHDIRRYRPDEYHQHVTAVFQGFSKFSGTVQENIGVGFVSEIRKKESIERAAKLAGAGHIIGSLPKGLKTILETSNNQSAIPFPDQYPEAMYSTSRHGLSGGEWQRIAISRAFMRAHKPEVELLVFDEPTSSLDAHAHNRVFDTIEEVSKNSSGERTKTVVFITHRLSAARRADKIAMMENGTITEFGSHQELLKQNGSYASLYRASV